VVAGPLLVSGCVATATRLERPRPAVAVPDGHIAVRAGRPGVVVAAPDSTAGAHTGEIADAIARRTGFGLVIATGVAVEADARRRVHETYARHVQDVAQGALDFYVEVHGNTRPESATRIEIATVGVDEELAARLRALAEIIRDAHLLAHPEARRLDFAVAPADEVPHAVPPAGGHAMLTAPRRALHIELPRAARVDFADVYTAVLADFLGQAVALPPPRW
jgi:hypothetical protein